MNLDFLAVTTLFFAGIPAGLFLLNLLVYRPLQKRKSQTAESVSVLIPARNEEQNIRATLEAAVANAARGCSSASAWAPFCLESFCPSAASTNGVCR